LGRSETGEYRDARKAAGDVLVPIGVRVGLGGSRVEARGTRKAGGAAVVRVLRDGREAITSCVVGVGATSAAEPPAAARMPDRAVERDVQRLWQL